MGELSCGHEIPDNPLTSYLSEIDTKYTNEIKLLLDTDNSVTG